MSLNLAAPFRTAIIGNTAIAPSLGIYENEPAVFTRRPVPDGAPYPMIVVNPDASIGDMDGLKVRLPIVTRDIIVYGLQPDDYRVVEDIGYALRDQFHRQKWALVVPGFSVIDIVITGPYPAPTDNENEVARMISARVRLEDLST